jgi:hypothetical protein
MTEMKSRIPSAITPLMIIVAVGFATSKNCIAPCGFILSTPS